MNQQKITPYLVLLLALVVIVPLIDYFYSSQHEIVQVYQVKPTNESFANYKEATIYKTPLLAEESMQITSIK